jgi:hypothetical protein
LSSLDSKIGKAPRRDLTDELESSGSVREILRPNREPIDRRTWEWGHVEIGDHVLSQEPPHAGVEIDLFGPEWPDVVENDGKRFFDR